jgi:putative ABC transport system permease protein
MDVENVQHWFDKHHIDVPTLYPIVRARLISINNKPVLQALKTVEARSHPSLKRELNLTWQSKVPTYEGQNGISIDEKLAQELGIVMGDTLGFRIGSDTVNGVVTQQRVIEWLSFQPNFYIIFSDGSLQNFPTTYMGSFYLPENQQHLLNQFVKTFTSISLIDVGEVIEQIRDLTEQVSYALQYLLLFTLIAGILVMFAAIQASQDERLYESKLLRLLGASRYQIVSSLLAEFITLGILAGLVASIGAIIIAYLISQRLLLIEYQFSLFTLLIGPIAGAMITATVGYFGIKRVIFKL